MTLTDHRKNVKAAKPISIAANERPMAPPIIAKALNSTSTVKCMHIIPITAAVNPVYAKN